MIVKNFVDVEDAVVKKEEEPKERPKPLQTFYLPYNRPLSVGFTDAHVSGVSVKNPQSNMIGAPVIGLQNNGAVGLQGIGLQTVGAAGLNVVGLGTGAVTNTHVVPVQAACPVVTKTVIEDPSLYYQTMGQKMSLAYNDYTFVPGSRCSGVGGAVFHGQGNDASTIRTNFSSHGTDDNNVANDGCGYYHRLGQRLAINFDED